MEYQVIPDPCITKRQLFQKNIRHRTQGTIDRPFLFLLLFQRMLREVRKDRRLHGHILAVVIHMIDSSVHNAHINRVIPLLVHDLRHIISAGRGQITSHLKRHFIRPLLPEQFHEGLQKAAVFRKIILRKIWDSQPGTEFQFPGHKAFLFLQAPDQFFYIFHFCRDLFDYFLLGACKILKSADIYIWIFVSFTDQPPHVLFTHSKLVAAGHPEQDLHMPVQFFCAAAHQIKLPSGLCGIMYHALLHGTAHIFILFIYTGQNNFLHIQPVLYADMEFSRRAHFVPLHISVQYFHQERVCLHGET